MTFSKTLIASSILAASSLTATVQAADASPITANIAAASNYIWRGQTQTGDQAAVSGGVDYAHDSGFSAGVWVSNVSGGYEQDLYVGYAGAFGPVSYDVAYTAYQYPAATSGDFDEISVSVGYEMFSFGIAKTVGDDDNTRNQWTKGDVYMSLGAEFEVKKGLTLGVLYGDYDFDNVDSVAGGTGGDYSHINVSLSKDDFSIAYDDTDEDGTAGKGRLTVSWSKSFDL